MHRFALLSPEHVQHVSRCEVSGPYLLVVGSTMVLCLVVTIIVLAFTPVVMKLLLVFFVSHVPVVHVF